MQFDTRWDTLDVGVHESLLFEGWNISQPPRVDYPFMSRMFTQKPKGFKPAPLKRVVTKAHTTTTMTSAYPTPTYAYKPALLPKEYVDEPPLSASPIACHDGLSDKRYGPAVITSNYYGSNIALFDLQGFSFGCAVLNGSDPHHAPIFPPRAQNCTLHVKGYAPGPGFDYVSGKHDFSRVKPAMEMVLWFLLPSSDSEPFNQTEAYVNAGNSSFGVETWENTGLVGKGSARMVQMESLDMSWWALGAVTMEADSGTGMPVQLCVDDVKYKTYSVNSWERGVAKLVHGQGP